MDKVKGTHSPDGSLDNKPSYLVELENKWREWTQIDEPGAFEALKDLSGDLWGELRKFEAILCKEIEDRQLPEDFKESLKARLRDTWRHIITHQKVGLDKLCIVIRKHMKE
jgi:hypothetical protein